MSVEKIGNINGVQQNFRTPKQNTDLDPFDLDIKIKELPDPDKNIHQLTSRWACTSGCHTQMTCVSCASCIKC